MRAMWAAVMLTLCSQVATQETLRPLFDFAAPGAAQNWQAVNDGVEPSRPICPSRPVTRSSSE